MKLLQGQKEAYYEFATKYLCNIQGVRYTSLISSFLKDIFTRTPLKSGNSKVKVTSSTLKCI